MAQQFRWVPKAHHSSKEVRAEKCSQFGSGVGGAPDPLQSGIREKLLKPITDVLQKNIK